jgi:hypothetical protein
MTGKDQRRWIPTSAGMTSKDQKHSISAFAGMTSKRPPHNTRNPTTPPTINPMHPTFASDNASQ